MEQGKTKTVQRNRAVWVVTVTYPGTGLHNAAVLETNLPTSSNSQLFLSIRVHFHDPWALLWEIDVDIDDDETETMYEKTPWSPDVWQTVCQPRQPDWRTDNLADSLPECVSMSGDIFVIDNCTREIIDDMMHAAWYQPSPESLSFTIPLPLTLFLSFSFPLYWSSSPLSLP